MAGSGIFTKAKLRSLVIGPHMAAFLPALAYVAFWWGGETGLLALAVMFPTLFVGVAYLTNPARSPIWAQDPVTGLPLRDFALRQLDSGFLHDGDVGGARISVAVEIDDWSALQNRHGREAADHILRQTADRVRGVIRPEDLLTSLGGARFGIVLKGGRRADLEAMIQLSLRLQSELGEPLLVDEMRVLITVSVGFCLPLRSPEPTGEASLAAAEAALAEAQRSGPASIRAFSNGMHLPPTVNDYTVSEIAAALEDGQIVPFFQPQISTDTGALSGFEALARWHHPDKGQIAPGAFLPAVARAGLFERLGEVILFKSLTALRDWDRAGLNVPSVSINLAPDELRNPKLFDKIRWELDRFDLSPERLTLEILETVVADGTDDTAARNIAALSALGCRIDLDDFGTGHASITSIRRFDVHRIKIDRSFITHVDTDRDQQNMVAAILTMAERLNVDTLAEGVETIGEHAMLAQLGCNHVQGYSIGKPMAFEKTGAWIEEHTKKLAIAPVLAKRA